MYISGGVAILVVLFSVLMMLGVVPFDRLVVGALLLVLSLGFVGPYFVRTS